MCGIAGIYRFKSQHDVNKKEILDMCEPIMYRGPDGSGEYIDGPVGLGHRRLTIIDTHNRSNQPMVSSDEEHIICYNGEVYNYLELKKSLHEKGVDFKTSSDTEVLLHMYREFGDQCVTQFNGMFSFAIWDKRKKSLFISRDRLGIKPLFYKEDEQGIIFSSELKSILALSPKTSVNKKLIDSYMSLGYCPTNKTLFDGIYKLEPGHSLTIENKKISISPYWDIEYDKKKDLGEEYYIKQTQDLFEDAVKLQLRSDVPLGVFLSGGIDSSAVVAMMNKLGAKKIKTFSVAWDHGNKFNETEYARKISKQFETEHHEYMMTAKDFIAFLPDYIKHMDEPVTEAAAISLYYLAKKAKEHVTVVLSGEGSDEVFGGYPIYRYLDIVSKYKKIPYSLRKFMINPFIRLLGVKWKKYADLSELTLEDSYFGVSFQNSKYKSQLYTPSFAKEAESFTTSKALSTYYKKSQPHDDQSRMQYLDYKTWLADDLLVKADRMSMAASLELRVPFLDHRLIDFTAKMPSHYRSKKGQDKYIIKKAMEPYLSDEILYRKKMGFPTPLAILFRGELTHFVKEILDSHRSHSRGYFNADAVRKIIDEHTSHQADHHLILWQLLVLELWHREYID